MTTHPYVSSETDRLAYQAGQNLVRRMRYENARRHLERLEHELIDALLQHPVAISSSIGAVEAAGRYGRNALRAGRDFDAAMAIALATLDAYDHPFTDPGDPDHGYTL